MAKLPALKPREVIRALQRVGFYLHHSTGSHRFYKHPHKPGVRVTVAFHTREVKRAVLREIIKQAELTQEEFLTLL